MILEMLNHILPGINQSMKHRFDWEEINCNPRQGDLERSFLPMPGICLKHASESDQGLPEL